MARYLVENTEEESTVTAQTLHNRTHKLWQEFGYEIDENGAVVGKNAATGELDPGAQMTEAYAIPQQRLDGKWIIPHPESLPYSQVVTGGGRTWEEEMMDGLDYIPIEEYDPSWFPPPFTPEAEGRQLSRG
jgi:hypothetical protein